VAVTRYIVANWKSNKTLSDAKRWIEVFRRSYRPNPQLKVILAPPFVFLAPLWQMLQEHGDASPALAVQDLSPFPLGSYTGAVAAEMVRDMVEYAILGHSERRHYFHETNQEVANKVSEARAAEIIPIVCVDQPYAASQIRALHETDLQDVIIGYGPAEAIGLGIPQSPEKTRGVIKEIQTIIPGRPILFGGSINAKNSREYSDLDGVSGLMLGWASLDPEEFAEICATMSR
jgi:triosephosphate isomerase